jgi:hypothetical protein
VEDHVGKPIGSVEAIEEFERIQTEFGPADLMMPDPLETGWRLPVTRIEFDRETQTILLVSDD